jgi:hypothetical protein
VIGQELRARYSVPENLPSALVTLVNQPDDISKYADALFVSEPFRVAGLRIYLKTKRQELLRAVIISQSQITYVDRGWSMKLSAVLPLVAFGVALTGVS